jgi:hypothetical protein
MEIPDDKMNNQTRLAEDHRRQLNRFRALLPHTPRAETSDSPSPSVSPISTQAFGGLLMLARTEEQVRSCICANPESAKRFARDAAMWGGLSAPYPPDTLRAVDEANRPFFVLGWLAGGNPEKAL